MYIVIVRVSSQVNVVYESSRAHLDTFAFMMLVYAVDLEALLL